MTDPCNGGLLQGSSTSDNILILLSCIKSQLAKKSSLYVCFVDFTRAFDLINRSILSYKLIKSGFNGKVVDTLRNLYTKTKSKVKLGSTLSPLLENTMAVNQGGRKPGILHSSFESSPIEIVTQYKYLGVMFSPSTTLKGNPFKNNHEYLAENGGKSVYGLFGYATTIGTPDYRFIA